MIRISARPRRALLGATATVFALAVLPGAAEAATVGLAGVGAPPGTPSQQNLQINDRDGQANRVRLAFQGANTVFVTDDRPLTTRTGCANLSPTQVQCTSPTRLESALVTLGPGDDTLSVPAGGVPLSYQGGSGNDSYLGGLSSTPQEVTFRGESGKDTASYAQATTGIEVNKGSDGGDGRPRFDNDTIKPDVENLIGSSFGDLLVGSDDNAIVETFNGGPGDDTMNGLRGFEVFETGSAPDGADRMSGGGADNQGLVDYSRRPAGVTVLQDGVAQDGQAGEGDNVQSMHVITGTNFRDTLGNGSAIAGTRFGIVVRGGGADDLLVGTAFDDTLNGEGGSDTYNAQGGNDSVSARDDVAENIECGPGVDSVDRDRTDTRANCETDRVGVLPRRSPSVQAAPSAARR